MTEMGCECLLPFEFEPRSFKNMEEKRMVYTQCTDSGAVTDQSTWCATRGRYVSLSLDPFECHLNDTGRSA